MTTAGDERYERLAHQVEFLGGRGLVSREMRDWSRQLYLLERLAGKDPSRLDPHLRERLHSELARATLAQLTKTALFEEWQAAWDGRERAEEPSVGPEQPSSSRRLPVRL